MGFKEGRSQNKVRRIADALIEIVLKHVEIPGRTHPNCSLVVHPRRLHHDTLVSQHNTIINVFASSTLAIIAANLMSKVLTAKLMLALVPDCRKESRPLVFGHFHASILASTHRNKRSCYLESNGSLSEASKSC